jgi:hypothetical protein
MTTFNINPASFLGNIPSSPRQAMRQATKKTRFATLNEALACEGLLEAWDSSYPPISYNETRSFTWDNGTKYGHLISIYRDERGYYERPVHYDR